MVIVYSGICVRSTNSLSARSAPLHHTPLPAIATGRFAARSNSVARATSVQLGAASRSPPRSAVSAALPVNTSTGIVRCTAPPRPPRNPSPGSLHRHAPAPTRIRLRVAPPQVERNLSRRRHFRRPLHHRARHPHLIDVLERLPLRQSPRPASAHRDQRRSEERR